eukprot:13647578-Alexandrium_andersonii.AAC.1
MQEAGLIRMLPCPGTNRIPAIWPSAWSSAYSDGNPQSARNPYSAACTRGPKTASNSTLQGLVWGVRRHFVR